MNAAQGPRKPDETRLLLQLAFVAETKKFGDTDARPRNALVADGLLETRKEGRTRYVSLAEAGWAWLDRALQEEHAQVSAREPLLQATITRLGRLMRSTGTPLAVLARATAFDGAAEGGASPAQAHARRAPADSRSRNENRNGSGNGIGNGNGSTNRNGSSAIAKRSTVDRLLDVCRDLAGGDRGARIRISELRAAVPDLDRDSVDAALLALRNDKRLALFPLDNRRDIRPEDKRDAVHIAGDPHHVLYLER